MGTLSTGPLPAAPADRLPAPLGRGWLLGIAALALLVRLAAIIALRNVKPTFEQEWEFIARVIVTHGFYGIDVNSDYGSTTLTVTSFIPPLYPVFLAAMELVFGSLSLAAIRVVQVLLSTASVLLICDLAQTLFGRPEVTVLTGLMAALAPPLLGSVVELDPVSFEVLLVLIFTRLTLPPRLAPHPPKWRWLAAGVALGLAALIRAPMLLLLPWLLVVLWVNRPPGLPPLRTVVGPVLVAGAAAAVVILPWTIRNYIVQRAFVPISTNGGVNFWIGNNAAATGEFVWPPAVAPNLLRASVTLSEPQRDQFFYMQGLSFIREHPVQAARLWGLKLLYFLWERPGIGGTYSGQPAAGLASLAYTLANALLLPFWLLGLALTVGNWRPMLVIYGPILSALAQNLIYFVATRFRTPAVPFEIFLAAVSVAWLGRAVWAWRSRRGLAYAAGAARLK